MDHPPIPALSKNDAPQNHHGPATPNPNPVGSDEPPPVVAVKPHRGSGLVSPSFAEALETDVGEIPPIRFQHSSEKVQGLAERITQAFNDSKKLESDLIDIEAEYARLTASARGGREETVTDKLIEMTHRFGPKLMDILGFQAVAGKCRIRVMDDGNRVEFDISPPSSTQMAVTEDQVRRILADQRIVYGIDEDAIASAVKTGRTRNVRGACIARGVPALPGNDGRIELVGETNSDSTDRSCLKIKKNPEIAALFPDITIRTAEKGQKIAVLCPPTPGIPGTNVYGEDIPARPGKPLRPRPGENVTYDSQTMEFYAEISGRVVLEGNLINVENFLLIGKDLDAALGHVKFPGELAVRGSVRNGVLVETRNDILIEGGMEAAQVCATDGSILIREGVQGGGGAFLSAKWDVTAGFIEQATVIAGGIIRTTFASKSELVAGDAVRVTDGCGEVISCKIYAGAHVEVNSLIAGQGEFSAVYIGRTPEELIALSQIRRRIQTLKKAISNAETELKRHMSAAGRTANGGPAEERGRKIERLAKRILILNAHFQKSREEEKKMDQTLEQRTHGRLDVRGRVYPGVNIYIGAAPYPVKKMLSWVRFQYDPRQKRIVALSLT